MVIDMEPSLLLLDRHSQLIRAPLKTGQSMLLTHGLSMCGVWTLPRSWANETSAFNDLRVKFEDFDPWIDEGPQMAT